MEFSQIIKFKRDTSFRQELFTPESFAHPAKLDSQLLLWIVEKYTSPGETILDPMFGSGTAMLACTLGRNVVGVELEEKFVKMAQANWEKVRQRPQLGSTMGDCRIIHGDARNLSGLLADHVVTSPPYADMSMGGGLNTKPPREGSSDQSGRSPSTPSQIGAGKYDKIVTSPPFGDMNHPTNYLGKQKGESGFEYSDNPANIGNLKYGDLQENNRMFVDCGQAFFELPSERIQRHLIASFSGIRINELKQDFGVFPFHSEIWGNLRKELSQAIISGHNTTEDVFTILTRICPDCISELRESLSYPRNCLLVAHTDFNARSEARLPGSVPAILLSNDIKTTFSVKQTSKISQINCSHKSYCIRYQPVCQLPYGQADKIITSPPYADNPGSPSLGSVNKDDWGKQGGDIVARRGLERVYNQANPQNIQNLPYGSIDSVITSPPYEEQMGDKHHSPRADKLATEKSNPTTYTDKVDHIVTSPPYEGTLESDKDDGSARVARLRKSGHDGIADRIELAQNWHQHEADYNPNNSTNIGNLKADSYLQAMAQVYSECFKVLKPGGLMILITKNFIREQKEIRLDLDTIKLCEQAGFSFKERWYRELPAQSFWRILYKKKFPDAPELKYEDVLVLVKEGQAR